MGVFLQGLTGGYFLGSYFIINIVSSTGHPFLSVSRLELLDAVLNLCAYHHPKDIILPSG